MPEKRIAIVGCGAIGSTFLAYLTRGGRDVTGIDPWPAHVHKVKATGLKVDAVEENFSVQPRVVFPDSVKFREKFDVVVLATKGQENRWSALYARDILADDGIFLSAQNGLHELYLPEVVGGGRVVGCVVSMGGELLGAGHLKFTTGSERVHVIFGELDGSKSDRLEQVGEIFSPLAPNELVTDIWSELWSKMTLNVMSNGIAGVSGFTAGTLWTNDVTTRIVIGTGHEVALVANALGQRFAPVMKTIPDELLRDATAPGQPRWEEAIELLKAQGAKRVGMRDNASSLLQDLRKGFRTEVDYFNGLIGELGRQVGVATPLNDLMVDAVHKVEEGQAESGPELLQEVAVIADKHIFG